MIPGDVTGCWVAKFPFPAPRSVPPPSPPSPDRYGCGLSPESDRLDVVEAISQLGETRAAAAAKASFLPHCVCVAPKGGDSEKSSSVCVCSIPPAVVVVLWCQRSHLLLSFRIVPVPRMVPGTNSPAWPLCFSLSPHSTHVCVPIATAHTLASTSTCREGYTS